MAAGVRSLWGRELQETRCVWPKCEVCTQSGPILKRGVAPEACKQLEYSCFPHWTNKTNRMRLLPSQPTVDESPVFARFGYERRRALIFGLISRSPLFSFFLLGEGFHNYHHSFPYDYATSEFGCKLNLTTCFIDLMCYLGLATDRKRVSREAIVARAQRTGDGSHRSG